MIGRGGHGAYPHTTIDPIVMAAQLVLGLQTIVSREIKPIEPCVITVGSIHGGTKHNIIGDDCHLQLTVRSYSDEVRQQIARRDRPQGQGRRRRRRRAGAEGRRSPKERRRCSTTRSWPCGCGRSSSSELGQDNVDDPEPSMGGEDFSQYGRAGVPILMFRLGTIEPQRLARMKQLGQDAAVAALAAVLSRCRGDARSPACTTTVAATLELLK